MKRYWIVFVVILLTALAMRLFIGLRWPNDEPDDGRGYALLAHNLMDQHVYSLDSQPPMSPTYVRVPGYPVFLASVYRVFGHDNNRAVRVIQAIISTATCLVVALLALAWAPTKWEVEKRRRAFLIALALAAVCPFTAVYVATILTETWAVFLISLSVLSGTYAFKAASTHRRYGWWGAAGLMGGAATLFRPDSAIFIGAIGTSLLVLAAAQALAIARSQPSSRLAFTSVRLPAAQAMLSGLALTAGFAVALVPWTIRNARVFHVFQPIAPEGAGMPGEFSYSGYISWLKTWVDDVKYVEIAEWPLDYDRIRIDKFPPSAFDSPEERAKVSALFDLYNHEPPGTGGNQASQPKKPAPPAAKSDDDDDDDDSSKGDDSSDDDDDSDDSSDAAHQSTSAVHRGVDLDVQMTPELDAAFGEIARERIARHPIKSRIIVPFRRALSMWFDTHSQYYPFEGELFPLAKLDHERHQQYWLPSFISLVFVLTAFGLGGALVLGLNPDARRWLLLLFLLTVPRLAFLSTLENPEPRYMVEYFPFVLAAGGLALAAVFPALIRQVRRAFRRTTKPAAATG
jgi:hypothetical protein